MASKGNKLQAVKSNSIDNWQTEQDARTLMDAITIRKEPERLKAAIDFAKTKVQQYKGVVLEAAEDALEDDDEGDE